MEQFDNIGLALKSVVLARPDQPAIVFDDMTLTYNQLWQTVRGFAAKMQENGVNTHDFVVVDTHEPLVAIASLFAAALLGPKYANSHQEVAELKRFTPSKYFHSTEIMVGTAKGSIEIDESWAPQHQDGKNSDSAGSKNKNAPWLIVHTSGSTGLPKYIGLSQAQVLARSEAAGVDFIAGETVFCSLFECTARPYTSRMLACLLNGATIVASDDPDFWVKAGVNLIMGSPAQVRKRLLGRVISPKILVLHVGGGKLADDIATELLQNFELVIDAYGASETNHSYNNLKLLDEDGDIVTTGEALDSLVEIVDANGTPCKLNEAGTVRVKNPYLADGYLESPEAQKKCFVDGWFYPGDIASWGPMRALNFIGREDHVINLGGAKINALVVDQIMATADGIAEAICFKNPKKGALNELLAFAVFDGSTSQLQAESAAIFACSEQLGDLMAPKRIRPINHIPRHPDGGPNRDACAELVLERQRVLQQKQPE